MECEEAKQVFEIQVNCCISCHEDDEMGYGNDLWFQLEGSEREWHICCAVERAIRKIDAKNNTTGGLWKRKE
jgi:hypothetical protein